MKNAPKKSLGQNFLRDEVVLHKIIAASDLGSEDFVIEIGPGEGVLTEQLAKHTKKVVAIELDGDLMPQLTEKFATQKNVEFIHADILNINLPALIENHIKNVETRHCLVSTPVNYKLIANIPYYITSPIIRLFLEQENQPKKILLMIQKEVAERIVASKGQMSILSISVQYYGMAEILFRVNKEAFFPVPKVDSAVIKITPNRKFNKELDKKFFRLVKAGFSAKRKTLANNLANSLQLDKDLVSEKLKALSLNENARAQELDIADWQRLAEIF
ncbi:MAG: Ribosomal RNA small subunit methyltransferase A [Candidatus Moranbacteria bacterium GW2011_GWA2_39_41]|nr:MAG: Ribosomal RNA small subunit methyltransferase A [Candidatus Moranbacteria bacterium GW2011_GWA2_39_41]